MKTFQALTLLVLMGTTHGALANRVLSVTSNEEQVTLTNEAGRRRWQLNEAVCLKKGNEELACGFIGRLTEHDLVIKIESRNQKIQAGAEVYLQREDRAPTANGETNSTTENVVTTRRRAMVDLTVGPVVGLNYLFPVVPTVQVAVSRALSLGVDFRFAQFTKAGLATHAIGGMLSANYYFLRHTFRGLFATVGVGLYRLDLKAGGIADGQTAFAVQGLVGWRTKPRWAFGVDIGVAGGFLFVSKKSPAVLSSDFGGVTPVASLYLGYSF